MALCEANIPVEVTPPSEDQREGQELVLHGGSPEVYTFFLVREGEGGSDAQGFETSFTAVARVLPGWNVGGLTSS